MNLDILDGGLYLIYWYIIYQDPFKCHANFKCWLKSEIRFGFLIFFRIPSWIGTMFWRETQPTHNPIIKLLAWSQMDMGTTNTDQWMHPSSNRTCFIRIGGICLLMLLAPNLLEFMLKFNTKKYIRNLKILQATPGHVCLLWKHQTVFGKLTYLTMLYCIVFVHAIHPWYLAAERTNWILTEFQLWSADSIIQCSMWVCKTGNP